MDIEQQYELAVLFDFFGPCERMIRLAGLTDDEVAAHEAGVLIPGTIREAYVGAYQRGMSVVGLVLEKHGPTPADPAIAAALDKMHKLLEHMGAGRL